MRLLLAIINALVFGIWYAQPMLYTELKPWQVWVRYLLLVSTGWITVHQLHRWRNR